MESFPHYWILQPKHGMELSSAFLTFQWDIMTPDTAGQPAKAPKLLDQMKDGLRLYRYALSTERAYMDWGSITSSFTGLNHEQTWLRERARWRIS
jgi:hypothetical protein